MTISQHWRRVSRCAKSMNDALGFRRTSGGKHNTISLNIDECKSVLVALDELEAAEKRIAELEAREVKLPLFDGYVPHIAAELQAAFRIACAAAGIITKEGE